MTIEELIEYLTRRIKQGKLSPETSVKVRNTAVSEEAMEAGSDGYLDLEDAITVDAEVLLLIGEGF